jgi:hypothetical protein
MVNTLLTVPLFFKMTAVVFIGIDKCSRRWSWILIFGVANERMGLLSSLLRLLQTIEKVFLSSDDFNAILFGFGDSFRVIWACKKEGWNAVHVGSKKDAAVRLYQ